MMSGAEGLFRLRTFTGEPAEMAALQAVFEAAPRYFEAVCGGPPGPAEAQSTFAFWHRIGFRETGEVRPEAPPFVGEVVVLEMPLAREVAAG